MGVNYRHRPARLAGLRPGRERPYRVVVVGGGTGSFTALTGLRRFGVDLSAVVSVMDSGGSSGRLRDEFGVLPPGDARRCLVALASDTAESELLRELFTYRFHDGRPPGGVDGHNLGNLLLTALTDLTGSAESAYACAGRLLAGQGKVIPVSTASVELCARLTDGHVVRGEASIDVRSEHRDASIEHIYLDRAACATQSAIDALRAADLVVLGPGDLYTSVLPNLLVDGIVDAVGHARHRVLVVNLMTKRGETDGFRASTFVRTALDYLAPVRLDAAVVNTAPPPRPDVLCRYLAEGAEPVEPDIDAIETLRVEAIAGPVASADFPARHDPAALACVLRNWLSAHIAARRLDLELEKP